MPTPERLYWVAALTAAGGLFFLTMGDPWMTGASLALSIGSALLAQGAERHSTLLRNLGYAGLGIALALLVIDTLQDVGV